MVRAAAAGNPFTSLPMLEVDNVLLSSSIAIATFLANSGNAKYLLGTNPTEQAAVDQWCSWISSEFSPVCATLSYATAGQIVVSEAEFAFIYDTMVKSTKIANV